MRGRRIWGAVALALAVAACSESDRSAGVIEGRARAVEAAPAGESRVLFGDLHVHTTFSIDAFLYALPLFAGEGVHPPADACDFARYCAQLDFFSINDHAESLWPARWRETVESIRQCDARAGDPPDLIPFLGYEWTQAGDTPEDHWGHRNVIFRGLADGEFAPRPITSLPDDTMDRASSMWIVSALQRLGPLGLAEYAHFLWLIEQLVETPDCEAGVPSRDLPDDCRENAATPAALFAKLREWDLDTLVIPHGLAWGIHAPPGARLDALVRGGNHDPEMERLLEVFSGHGSSEEYRPTELVRGDGELVCPAPTEDFVACCWRAGELVRARCGELPAGECEARVREARQLALEAGTSPHMVLPDATVEEWGDCDQCRDCFKPAGVLRPMQSAQYGATLPGLRWGFIGSSDNHSARPGTGYKQIARRSMTDARGFASPWTERLLRPWVRGRQDDPQRAQPAPEGPRGFRSLLFVERQASYLYPGGLVAAHATDRSRDALWGALMRREVYGTSGPRILLWFELENAPGGPRPMGSEVALAAAPRFTVRAVGAQVQQPGCPDESLRGLSPERLERLCRGECHHPSDERHAIAAIEVVRVLPRTSPEQATSELIQDPWRRLECPPDPSGCSAHFEDPELRSATYYARAVQEPTPAINGANAPCSGSWRTPADDDCLAPVQERAWSSPIWVRAVR